MDDKRVSTKSIVTDILILGGGPAGMAAAIYAARAGWKTTVLEGRAASRLSIDYVIENYPGFISIKSSELLQKFREHSLYFKAKIYQGDALNVSLATDPKYIATQDMFIEAPAVIICTGRPLSKGKFVKGEEKFVGRGVSYCSNCDGPLYIGKKVAAIGSSQEAIAESIALQKMGCFVIWFPGLMEETDKSDEAVKKLKKAGIITFPNSLVREISGKGKAEKIVVEENRILEEMEVSAVFIFREIPTAPLFSKAGVELDYKQCINVDRMQRTNLEGVYAAGDVTCGGMQVVTAVGEGAVAAMQAVKYLRQKEENETSTG
jgi:thioredoxin reductase (NADPH)